MPTVLEYSPNADVIVADNASSDDSISYVKDNFPTVGIIKNEGNYGFAKGYNEALKKVDNEYLVLLNSDIEVTPNWLDPIVKLFDQSDEIAACQPKILDYKNKEYFEYAGAAGGYVDKWGYPFCRGRIFDVLEKDEGQYNDTKEIFWATGACLFIKKKAFDEVGGLDDFFFAHMEEIDLCWRLLNKGYKVMYCGDSSVYHVGGGTLNKTNARKTFLNFRNNLLLLHKNLPKSKVFSVIFLRLMLDGLAGIKFLTEGKFSHFMAIIKAHFAFYGAIAQNKKKRIESAGKAILYPKSIIYWHYLKGVKKFTDLK